MSTGQFFNQLAIFRICRIESHRCVNEHRKPKFFLDEFSNSLRPFVRRHYDEIRNRCKLADALLNLILKLFDRK
ncbi:hypothetical protein WI44_22305 [Burkholderia cepacia]|nr:hypothetical protein WI44_22305 [Burkholderia cepacia]KVA41204.1 hypothetical protein WI45_18450 [Burkholderia cepacia]